MLLYSIFYFIRASVRFLFAASFGTRIGVALIVAVPVALVTAKASFDVDAVIFKQIIAADAEKIKEVQADAEKRIASIQDEAKSKVAAAQAELVDLQGKLSAAELKIHPPPVPAMKPKPAIKPLDLSPLAK